MMQPGQNEVLTDQVTCSHEKMKIYKSSGLGGTAVSGKINLEVT